MFPLPEFFFIGLKKKKALCLQSSHASNTALPLAHLSGTTDIWELLLVGRPTHLEGGAVSAVGVIVMEVLV